MNVIHYYEFLRDEFNHRHPEEEPIETEHVLAVIERGEHPQLWPHEEEEILELVQEVKSNDYI